MLELETPQEIFRMNVGLTGCEARYRGPLLSTHWSSGGSSLPSFNPGPTGPASCPPRFPALETESPAFDKVHCSWIVPIWTVVTLSGSPRHIDCMLCPPCHVGRAPGVAAPPQLVPPAFQFGLPGAVAQIPGFQGSIMQSAKDLGGRLVPQWTSGTDSDHFADSWLAWGLPHPP